MHRLISLSVAAALWACGAPLPPRECTPTVIQPARHAPVTLISRVAGCNNLVAVSGGPGIVLYVLRVNLREITDAQINALPEVGRGEG